MGRYIKFAIKNWIFIVIIIFGLSCLYCIFEPPGPEYNYSPGHFISVIPLLNNPIFALLFGGAMTIGRAWCLISEWQDRE